MISMQWEKAPYGQPGEFVDVTGLGRYMVRPEVRGLRTWRAYLNGKPTAYTGSRDVCKAAVQRAVEQYRLTNP